MCTKAHFLLLLSGKRFHDGAVSHDGAPVASVMNSLPLGFCLPINRGTEGGRVGKGFPMPTGIAP